MSALDDIVRDGKVRFVGLSNFKLDEIEACMAVRRVDVVQYGWNMFDRRMQREILPYCAEQGVGFMAYGSLAFGLLTGTFTEDHDFGGADWRARQGNMGAIKMFAALFGPEKFKDNVRAVERAEGHRGPLRQEPAAARAALGDLAPGGEHRARRLPHRRRGRGQRRRGRLDDQRRRPRRDRRDLRPPRHRHHARLLDRRSMTVGGMSRGPSSRERSRSSPAARAGWAAASSSCSWRRARASSSPTSTREGGEALAAELGAAAAFQRPTSRDADQIQAAVDFAVERFGGLHVMCNNAGIGGSFKRVPRRRLRRLRPRDGGEHLRRDGRDASARRATWRSTAAARSSTPRRSAASTPAAGVMAYRATKARGDPPHPVDRGRARRARHPGELHRARAHPDRDQRELDQSLIVRAMQPLQRVGSPPTSPKRSCSSRAIGPRRSRASCCRSTAGRRPGRRRARASPTELVKGSVR